MLRKLARLALHSIALGLTLLLAAAPTVRAPAAAPAPGWNDGQIAWRTAEEGLAEARRIGRPVLVLVHTAWCPHCRTYRALFQDPRVVELSQQLVMVIIDRDKEPETSARYAPDGAYIPRTLFLDSHGKLDSTLTGRRWRYRHFLETATPDELLALMRKAVAR